MPEISTVISTERLVLRGWRESDLAPWAAMNADPEVRQYVGPLLTFEQAAACGVPETTGPRNLTAPGPRSGELGLKDLARGTGGDGMKRGLAGLFGA
jgi:hypothetical protein